MAHSQKSRTTENRGGNRGKAKPDANELAFRLVQQANGQIEKPQPKEKNLT